jgi:hypothetical protein
VAAADRVVELCRLRYAVSYTVLHTVPLGSATDPLALSDLIRTLQRAVDSEQAQGMIGEAIKTINRRIESLLEEGVKALKPVTHEREI